MIENHVIKNLRQQYANVHPLLFHRSVERANTAGELFDLLESLPKKMPIIWDEKNRKWAHTSDLSQSAKFEYARS